MPLASLICPPTAPPFQELTAPFLPPPKSPPVPPLQHLKLSYSASQQCQLSLQQLPYLHLNTSQLAFSCCCFMYFLQEYILLLHGLCLFCSALQCHSPSAKNLLLPPQHHAAHILMLSPLLSTSFHSSTNPQHFTAHNLMLLFLMSLTGAHPSLL